MPYQANFVEKHLKEARKCNTSLDYHWLAYISEVTQPAMNGVQSHATQEVTDSSNSAKWSIRKRTRYGKCFGNIFSKAKARRKDEEVRYRVQNQDAIEQARFVPGKPGLEM